MIYLIILLGLILRLINLGQSFWLDEAAQLVMSQQSLSWIWIGRAGDFHPPLFYFLTHFWQQFSSSEIILRALPVMFGVLAVPAVYLLSSHLFSKKIGLYAALFTAINPYLVYYSQEMRSYSLMLFLSILSMNYLIRRQWLWLLLTNTLLLYTHYSSILFLLSQFIYILFYIREILKKSCILYLGSWILYLPWLPQLFRQLNSGLNIDQFLPGWRAELTLPFLKSVPLIFFKFTAGRIDLEPNIVYLIYVAFVLIGLLAVLYLAKKSHPILTVWLILPIFLSIFLSRFIPQTQPFRLIYCLPPLLIYFALAASNHPKKTLTFLLYVFIVGNFMQITRPRLQREQWRQATNFLNQQNLPVVVKFFEAFAPLKYYQLKSEVISVYPVMGTTFPDKFMLIEYLTGLTDPSRNVESKIVELGYK